MVYSSICRPSKETTRKKLLVRKDSNYQNLEIVWKLRLEEREREREREREQMGNNRFKSNRFHRRLLFNDDTAR